VLAPLYLAPRARRLEFEPTIQILEAGEEAGVVGKRRLLNFVSHCSTFIPASRTGRETAHAMCSKTAHRAAVRHNRWLSV